MRTFTTTCGSKVKWASYSIAEKQARKMRRQGKGRVSAYRCPMCRGWHVGETTRWRDCE